jgi:hypothetical protein
MLSTFMLTVANDFLVTQQFGEISHSTLLRLCGFAWGRVVDDFSGCISCCGCDHKVSLEPQSFLGNTLHCSDAQSEGWEGLGEEEGA